MIDLRSDTVTRPTAAMRHAMATAEVGDDVYGEDPTLNLLEKTAATLFGKEAAIFVPTGTMGNQIAIRLHTQHGQEVITESRAHIFDWEMAMTAAFAGCQVRPVTAERGILTWPQIASAIGSKIYYRAQTALVCLENTHNMAGGTVSPLATMQEIWAGAAEAGLPVHLDGARVFNAATALGISVAELTSGFDTVNFCLSKGLGAPVGSMLVGSAKHIEQARIHRKALGGGMRQAGILAAAGLIALNEMPARLHEDHAKARLIAETVAAVPTAHIDLDSVQTNIVILPLPGKSPSERGDAAAFSAALKQKGVLISVIDAHTVRFVTHYDVSTAQCEEAAHLIAAQLQTV